MGRRSRQRSGAPPPGDGEGRSPEATSPLPPRRLPASPRRRARIDELPPAPWAPFPLVELCILVGIVLVVLGFVRADATVGLCGLALVTLGTVEQTLREHLAGVRSHSLLLAGVTAVACGSLAAAAGVARLVVLAVAAALFVAGAFALRALFRRRSGGVGFRA